MPCSPEHDPPRSSAASTSASRTASASARSGPGLADARLAAVHLDQQARRLGEPEPAEAVQRADRALVEELDGGEVDAEADQVRGRPRRGPRLREAEPALPAGGGQPGQRE